MSEGGDPLPDRLGRLLDDLAAEDAAAVLDEARTRARERVRARVSDELARRMLRRIGEARAAAAPAPADRPEAAPEQGERRPATSPAAEPPAEGETGVYVYAVVESGAAPPTDAIRGIGDAPVRTLASRAGGLQALVSDVPLDQFGDEALKRNLNELPWLSATALAHEAVVEAALAGTTLVPMRMCTIFRDDDGVRDMLEREAGTLTAALERLRGSNEWGVKVIADAEAFAAAVARDSERVSALRDDAGATGEGAGYFAALRLDQATREEVTAQLDRRTREIHDAFAALASDHRLHQPSNRELAGYEGEMVLNGAYLVAAERTDELRALAASLADRHRPHGLSVELTGPWPPYNFSMLAGGL